MELISVKYGSFMPILPIYFRVHNSYIAIHGLPLLVTECWISFNLLLFSLAYVSIFLHLCRLLLLIIWDFTCQGLSQGIPSSLYQKVRGIL